MELSRPIMLNVKGKREARNIAFYNEEARNIRILMMYLKC